MRKQICKQKKNAESKFFKQVLENQQHYKTEKHIEPNYILYKSKIENESALKLHLFEKNLNTKKKFHRFFGNFLAKEKFIHFLIKSFFIFGIFFPC